MCSDEFLHVIKKINVSQTRKVLEIGRLCKNKHITNMNRIFLFCYKI